MSAYAASAALLAPALLLATGVLPAWAGSTELISVSSSGVQGDSSSDNPVISADGRYVAFLSYATNLVPGDTNGTYDMFMRDRQMHTTELVASERTALRPMA